MKPHLPNIILSDVEGYKFHKKRDSVEFAKYLIDGHYVLIKDYYYSGLNLLNALKKLLKPKFGKSFEEGRKYRLAYRAASHRLILEITDHYITVKKSPDIGWLKILFPSTDHFFISFPEIQGLNSSWQWYLKGIKIKFLNKRLNPYYGVYFPTRFDHLELFNDWLASYNGSKELAIDVGIGSGVLSLMLLKNDFLRVIGTDINPNAIIGMREESKKFEVEDRLDLIYGDLFADCNCKADLIVFNPPWIKAMYNLEDDMDRAIYYEDTLFPRFFAQAKNYLKENGKLIILFSNLGSVVDKDGFNPILAELENKHFSKTTKMRKKVKILNSKAKRKNWRKNERVELWELTHYNK